MVEKHCPAHGAQAPRVWDEGGRVAGRLLRARLTVWSVGARGHPGSQPRSPPWSRPEEEAMLTVSEQVAQEIHQSLKNMAWLL